MDWRHNQWVGVGAAILVVAGIVGIFFYLSRPTYVREHGGYTYQCAASGQTFKISDSDMEKESVYLKYYGKTDPVECRFDSNNDAHWSYYCPECKQYYAYTRIQAGGSSGDVSCPKGHEIPEADR